MNILVTGLIRNGSSIVSKEIEKLRRALSKYESISFLVIESDSTDNTASKLHDLAGKYNNFRFISLGNLETELPRRTDRIAHCRNLYLTEIRENPLYKNINFVIITDLDGTNNLLSEESFDSCWKLSEEWDICTANQDGPYYDLWALRHTNWCPNDCWEDLQKYLSMGVPRHKALWASTYSKMITIPKSSPLIEVESAFGGLAIYKREALLGDEIYDGSMTCEHVGFHQQLRKKGFKIAINPALINCGINEHNKKATFPYTLYFLLDGFLLKFISFFRKS